MQQIHISELQQYIRCPRSYRLRYIDGIDPAKKSLPQCKATCVRRTIAHLHMAEKPVCDFSKEEIEAFCSTIWQEEISDPIVDQAELEIIAIQEKPATKKRSAIAAITKGEKILRDITTWIWEYSRTEIDAKVLHTNVYFQIMIGDTEFCGSIDQVREHPKLGLQIITFNASSQAPNEVFLQHDFAISLYVYAVWQGFLYPDYPDMRECTHLGAIPSAYIFYLPHLERYEKNCGKAKKGEAKGNPMIAVARSEKALLDFEYDLLYTVSGIQTEFFPKMPRNPCGCHICPFSQSCGETDGRKATEILDYQEETL